MAPQLLKNKRIVRKASYLDGFRCIGGVCEDNCCIGWAVEIDKQTYGKYVELKDTELKKLIGEKIYLQEESYDENVDFALVELGRDQRCPFLNRENLCKIQAKMGEDHLSNVCATYPRMTNEINGVLECSATISCPEMARLILGSREKLTFKEEKIVPARSIISLSVDTRANGAVFPIKNLLVLRDFTITLLQMRNFPLSERMIILGLFFQKMEQNRGLKKPVALISFIDSFRQKLKEGKLDGEIDAFEINEAKQFDLLLKITNQLNDPNEIDSREYLAFINEFRKGAGMEGKKAAEQYSHAVTNFYEPFMRSREFILENYLVNHVFQSLFPAGDSVYPLDAFQKLVQRYSLIKLYLTGIGNYRKGLDEKTVIEFLQVFSKALEHHHRYFERLYLQMKKYKCNTMIHKDEVK